MPARELSFGHFDKLNDRLCTSLGDFDKLSHRKMFTAQPTKNRPCATRKTCYDEALFGEDITNTLQGTGSFS
jgi:hypothetical protein